MKIDSIYQELTEAFGISSREENIKTIVLREIKKYPNYEIIKDNLGSIFAYKKSKKSKCKNRNDCGTYG